MPIFKITSRRKATDNNRHTKRSNHFLYHLHDIGPVSHTWFKFELGITRGCYLATLLIRPSDWCCFSNNIGLNPVKNTLPTSQIFETTFLFYFFIVRSTNALASDFFILSYQVTINDIRKKNNILSLLYYFSFILNKHLKHLLSMIISVIYK